MKITGYKKRDTELEGLTEMESIAIAASPETIRELAKFLNHAADLMEEMGSDYDHIHLTDEWDDWKDGLPDLQVISEKYISQFSQLGQFSAAFAHTQPQTVRYQKRLGTLKLHLGRLRWTLRKV